MATAALGALTTMGSSIGVASADVSSNPLASVTAAPTVSNSLSSWQAWAAQQQQVMQATNWDQALSNSQCTVDESTIVPVTSDGTDGIPAGVTTDIVEAQGSCTPSSSASSTSSNVSSTARQNVRRAHLLTPRSVPTFCTIQSAGVQGAATGGVVCVGTTIVGGSNDYMAASYVRTANTTSFGHPELGAPPGSSCVVGSAVANGHPEMTVGTGDFAAVIWGPRGPSNYWSATWWQDNGGGNYSNFGTVCGTY